MLSESVCLMAADRSPLPVKIRFRFHGPLRRYVAHLSMEGSFTAELEPGCTLFEALRRLGVPAETEWAAVVGDRIVPWRYVPHPEETITILPPLAGG